MNEQGIIPSEALCYPVRRQDQGWARKFRFPLLLLFAGVAVWMVIEICAYLCMGRHDSLVFAARAGDIATVRQLARFDPYLSRVGFEEHYTPLIAAVLSNNEAMVRFLLEKGVDVNATDDDGFTALKHAGQEGHKAIARLLERHGARL